MKETIIERNTKIKVFSENCPICNVEIKGYSESQVKYNLRLHREKHNKKS